jgi:hypothetical protein
MSKEDETRKVISIFLKKRLNLLDAEANRLTDRPQELCQEAATNTKRAFHLVEATDPAVIAELVLAILAIDADEEPTAEPISVPISR